MFRIAIGLLVVAIIAAIFGFGGIAAVSTDFAKIVFVVALVLAVVGFIFGRGRGAIIALLAGAGLLGSMPNTSVADEASISASAER